MIMSELATFPRAVAQTLRTRSASYLRLAADRLWHLDFVLIALGALFVGPYLFSADQAFSTSRYVASELAHIGPWLAASVFVAAVAKATGADSLATRVFRGRQSRMVVVASLIGALLPFCSCGVIPLVAGLLGAGVPLAPVMAFWISSPLMDPTLFFVIAGSLGIGFAIAKTAAAIGMGLLGGYGTMLLARAKLLSTGDALRITVPRKSCSRSGKPAAAAKPVWRFWQEGERAQVFLTASATTAWFLIRWLALAFVIESLMTAWLPPEMIARWLGTGPFAIPFAVLIGVP